MCPSLSLFACEKSFCFVKDFSGTTLPRVLKFGTNIEYDLLYCVRENQHPHINHSLYLSILAHLSKKCSRWAIVIGQCLWCVMQHQQFALKAFSSYTPGSLTPNLVWSIRMIYRSKIAKIVPIGNPRWPPSWKWIFHFFFLTERPIDLKLGRKHWMILDKK